MECAGVVYFTAPGRTWPRSRSVQPGSERGRSNFPDGRDMSAKTRTDWPAEILDRVETLLDREAVRDTIYRYGSVIDAFDRVGVRSVLSDDMVAQYGNDEPIMNSSVESSARPTPGLRSTLSRSRMLSVSPSMPRGNRR